MHLTYLTTPVLEPAHNQKKTDTSNKKCHAGLDFPSLCLDCRVQSRLQEFCHGMLCKSKVVYKMCCRAQFCDRDYTFGSKSDWREAELNKNSYWKLVDLKM